VKLYGENGGIISNIRDIENNEILSNVISKYNGFNLITSIHSFYYIHPNSYLQNLEKLFQLLSCNNGRLLISMTPYCFPDKYDNNDNNSNNNKNNDNQNEHNNRHITDWYNLLKIMLNNEEFNPLSWILYYFANDIWNKYKEKYNISYETHYETSHCYYSNFKEMMDEILWRLYEELAFAKDRINKQQSEQLIKEYIIKKLLQKERNGYIITANIGHLIIYKNLACTS